jgi:hypothetical protein
VTMATAKHRFDGRDAVAERLTGQWSMTPVLAAGTWEIAELANGETEATGDFGGLGAAPVSYRLRFTFDASDKITSIVETMQMPTPPTPAKGMSAVVRKRIDRALADGKPIILGYVDDAGDASLSLRGSIQTLDDVRLALWIRDANSGLVRAIRAGRPLSFLYRDSATRTTLIGKGIGRIIDQEPARRDIYDLMPEVEQRHDIVLAGAAAVIEIVSIRGTSPEGSVLIIPERGSATESDAT